MVGLLEEKLKTKQQFERRNTLESKAVPGIEMLSESKGYRMWNRKMKNVLEQCWRPARKILMWLDTVAAEAVSDEHDAVCDPLDAKIEAIYWRWRCYIEPHKDNKVTREEFDEMNKDLWGIGRQGEGRCVE